MDCTHCPGGSGGMNSNPSDNEGGGMNSNPSDNEGGGMMDVRELDPPTHTGGHTYTHTLVT